MNKKSKKLIFGAIVLQSFSSVISTTYGMSYAGPYNQYHYAPSVLPVQWVSVPGIVGGNLQIDFKTGTIIDADDTITIANIPAQINGITIKGIGDNAFNNNSHLTMVNIPTTISYIGNGAFYGCNFLQEITIPSNIKSIGEYAFGFCWNLTAINIFPGIESIGKQAFENCFNLKTINIPNTVTYIGEQAFAWCNNLSTVTLPNTIAPIYDNYIFKGCQNLSTVYFNGNSEEWDYLKLKLPQTARAIYTLGNTAIQNINANSGEWVEVSTIKGGRVKFDKFTGAILAAEPTVTVANIPKYINGITVLSIAEDAFLNCYDLSSISIPKTISNCSFIW
ncbi:hypothetical protein AN641_06350 [Candidatus Epulonipiscioides gigas]|nr:hypothetical protein AN641_06350 [Epulopiscium sp. SCG-C07WGA-EpuloA2]